jgi:hypothetical protein
MSVIQDMYPNDTHKGRGAFSEVRLKGVLAIRVGWELATYRVEVLNRGSNSSIAPSVRRTRNLLTKNSRITAVCRVVSTENEESKMRRSVLLVLSVALAVLVFAPLAAAQTNYKGMGGNQAGHMRVDDRGMDNHMMASPTSSASASASAISTSPTASASAMSTSASASASPTSSASATMSASPTTRASATALPETGGTPLIPLLSAAVLVLLVSSGIGAIALIHRTS